MEEIILTIAKDGHAFICYGPGFIDLQQSHNYAYGDTVEEAVKFFLEQN